LRLLERARPVEELAELLDLTSEDVIDYFKKLEKKQLVEPDRLIFE
jgi:predicted transcriptional regulator